jgi:hypothetical protein
MRGEPGRWLLAVGLTCVFSLQSGGVDAGSAAVTGAPFLLLDELIESVSRSAPVELLAPEPVDESVSEEEESEPVEAPRVVPACSEDVMLIGAVTNERNPELSRVVVRTHGGAAVVAAGGRVGAFVVDAVQTAGALLRDGGGSLCALRGFARGADTREPTNVDEVPPVAPRGKPVFSALELADGLQKLGDGDYLVKKAFLLKALTNPGGSAGGAWFRPAQLDGADTGMEVLGIRAGTALDAMGVRNGDVIRDLNGISLDAAPNLITALRSAREAGHVSISFVREGRPQELRYRIE